MNHKVSIIISTYNQVEYLEQSILSALNQTYKNKEVLVINDRSTDNTNNIIEQIKNKYPMLHVEHTDDIGASKSRNWGVSIINSDFFIFLDGDDWIDNYYIEKTIPLMLKGNKLGFVYVNTIYVKDGIHSPVPSPEYSFYNLIHSNFISYCSLYNREAYIDCGGYNINNFGYFEDYELYLNLGRQGWYGKHVAENLFFYRVYDESSFQSTRAKTLFPLYRSYLINKYPEIHPPEWLDAAKKMLDKFPADFMKWKPREQEEYLKNVAITK